MKIPRPKTAYLCKSNQNQTNKKLPEYISDKVKRPYPFNIFAGYQIRSAYDLISVAYGNTPELIPLFDWSVYLLIIKLYIGFILFVFVLIHQGRYVIFCYSTYFIFISLVDLYIYDYILFI